MTDIFPESREEEILVSTINGEEYDKAPESRIEALLLELKEVIEEGGGGGGGTSNYNQLTNKPSINGITLSGNKTNADLGIPDVPLTGLGMGSKTTYSALSGVIDTNVILFRTPKNGDRLTVFIGDEIYREGLGNYLSLTIYGESYSDVYTYGISTPGSVWDGVHRVSGICIFEVHTDLSGEIDKFDLIAMYEPPVTPIPVINTVRGLSVDLSYNNATN